MASSLATCPPAHTQIRSSRLLVPPAAVPRHQTWPQCEWLVSVPIPICACAWYDDTYSTWSETQWGRRRRCVAWRPCVWRNVPAGRDGCVSYGSGAAAALYSPPGNASSWTIYCRHHTCTWLYLNIDDCCQPAHRSWSRSILSGWGWTLCCACCAGDCWEHAGCATAGHKCYTYRLLPQVLTERERA